MKWFWRSNLSIVRIFWSLAAHQKTSAPLADHDISKAFQSFESSNNVIDQEHTMRMRRLNLSIYPTINISTTSNCFRKKRIIIITVKKNHSIVDNSPVTIKSFWVDLRETNTTIPNHISTFMFIEQIHIIFRDRW